MKATTVLTTADRCWRVEIVQHGRSCWYRLRHDGNEIDWLSIAAVKRILSEAGVNMAELIEVTDDPPPPARHGVA